MQNLGLTRDRFFGSDQSQPGSALDAFVQAIFPPFAVMRNAQAMFDPKYAPGTIFGLGHDAYQGGKGLLGFGSTPEGGLLGQSSGSFDDSGYGGYTGVNNYGYDTYNFGGDEVGVETTAFDGMSQQDIDDYGGMVSEF